VTRFPRPLRPGDRIAVTAPSSGVSGDALPRLDLVLQHLRDQGYGVVEGQCLRDERFDASAPAAQRAAELSRFLHDPTIAAILPPWGGERATELLERIDFAALRPLAPKWLLGFSDLSTLMLPLTLVAGWATAHGPNLMDLAPTQVDPLTTGAMRLLATPLDRPVRQAASDRYQVRWIPFEQQVDAALQLTEPTRWWRLDGQEGPVELRGRLIGGCLDTVAWLAGTRYGDVPQFVRQAGDAGALLYLENCELAPAAELRALTALRRHGWFDQLRGVLVGRSAAPDPSAPDALTHAMALQAVLGDLPCPVLVDVDIGHRPPQFTLINGAYACVGYEAGSGWITQSADAPA